MKTLPASEGITATFAIKFMRQQGAVAWMKRAPLPDSERALLDEDRELHTLMQAQIDALKKRLVANHAARPDAC